jgi:hypothetical protein
MTHERKERASIDRDVQTLLVTAVSQVGRISGRARNRCVIFPPAPEPTKSQRLVETNPNP